MQFKSFLVPTKGRSNYFQGSINNSSGNTTVISGGGGGGGSAIAETDFIYCMRRILGTEELTADQMSHNKLVYEKLLSLKGRPGSTPIFYIYGTGNNNPVKYDWVQDTLKSAPETKAYPPDWEKPEPPDPGPGESEKGDTIRFTFIDPDAEGTAYLYVGKLTASGQTYISSKTTVGGGKDFQPDIDDINNRLGKPGDETTADTAFARIEFNKQTIDDINLVLNEYAGEITKIGNNLGEPTDDGSTAGQTDTAFGRIKKLENGERPSLLTLSPVVQKNCFYLDSGSSPDSKALNVENFKNIMFYYGQDPLCSVPVVIRPNQDFDGVWPAINVIPQQKPSDPYKQFSSAIVSFIKKDYETDKKFYVWTYEVWKDGKVDFIDKRNIEGAPVPPPVQKKEKQYILKTKRDTSKTTTDTNIYTIIENIDSEIIDNADYRICFMQWKRHNREGMKWTVPMFCGEWSATTGEWSATHPNGTNITTKYNWADTWWPIHYETIPGTGLWESGVRWFSNTRGVRKTLSQMVDLTISISKQFHNHNKKMRIGVAIFKHTGSGNKGWTRVSNIAEILCFAPSGAEPVAHVEVKN